MIPEDLVVYVVDIEAYLWALPGSRRVRVSQGIDIARYLGHKHF